MSTGCVASPGERRAPQKQKVLKKWVMWPSLGSPPWVGSQDGLVTWGDRQYVISKRHEGAMWIWTQQEQRGGRVGLVNHTRWALDGRGRKDEADGGPSLKGPALQPQGQAVPIVRSQLATLCRQEWAMAHCEVPAGHAVQAGMGCGPAPRSHILFKETTRTEKRCN